MRGFDVITHNRLASPTAAAACHDFDHWRRGLQGNDNNHNSNNFFVSLLQTPLTIAASVVPSSLFKWEQQFRGTGCCCSGGGIEGMLSCPASDSGPLLVIVFLLLKESTAAGLTFYEHNSIPPWERENVTNK